ncbi:MAG: SusD/RagB family nutrient-binding outer membrane lipoprotein [Bacteroidia bacterium]
MKKNFLSSLFLAGLVLFSTSCGEFGDINIDPNNTVSVAPETLLTNALRSVRSVESPDIGALYSQHLAETQYSDASRYLDVNFDFNGWYTGPLADLNEIIRLNSSEDTQADALASGSNANQIAVARILKAFFFHHMTDRWGALPYTTALQGRENFKPNYDSQEVIYDQIFAELEAAVAQMDGGAGVDGDFIFGGDMDKWARFANTVRMVAALRLSEVNETKAKAQFAAAVAGGLIEEDAMYPYLGETNNQNPWFGRFITRTDYAISNILADRLRDLNDLRLNAYADPAPATGDVQGMPYGIEDAGSIPNDDVSFPSSVTVRAQDAPIGIFTMAQVNFSLAEAAARGWTSDNAEDMYNLGVKASMEQWGVFEETAYNDYITNDAPYNAADPLPGIGEQKWIALYLQGYEAWKEWRRTGYPDLQPAPDPLNASGQIPRRQAYPTSERDVNEANYDAAVSAQGPDELSTKTWWDVR